MSSCEIELLGLNEVIEKLKELERVGESAISKALEKGAEPILNNMKNSDMFDNHTGDLKKALKVSPIKTRKKVKVVWIGDVDRKAPHAWYLENGSSRSIARPFMRTAWREEKEKALAIMKQEMIQALKEVSGK